MSTKIDPQQNVRFLISCIRHSNGGKVQSLNPPESTSLLILVGSLTLEQVDFEAVAKELDIVTRAAAYVVPPPTPHPNVHQPFPCVYVSQHTDLTTNRPEPSDMSVLSRLPRTRLVPSRPTPLLVPPPPPMATKSRPSRQLQSAKR